MKYKALFKASAPMALLYGGLAAVMLLGLEVFWPLMSGKQTMMSVNWVSWAALIGWVTGITMNQSVMGLGFQTGTSRKTMWAVLWSLGGVVAVGFSLFSLLGQNLFMQLGLRWTTQTSGFPKFMLVGNSLTTFSFLGLLALLTFGLGSLLGLVIIYLPAKVLLPAAFVAIVAILPMLGIALFISVWGAQQLWPELMHQAWVWLISIGGFAVVFAGINFLVYQQLDAPEQFGRRR